MLKRTNILIALLAATLAAGELHASNLYKWTDEAGTVHYTQSPPTEQERKEVAPEPEPDTATDEDAVVESQVAIPPEQPGGERLQRAELCQQRLEELRRYEERLPIVDSEGNPVVVSEEMRESRMEELKRQLDEECR